MTILNVVGLGSSLVIALSIYVLSLVGHGEPRRSGNGAADIGETEYSAR